MDPDRIVNTSTACLVVLKLLFWAIPGVNLSAGGAAVTVIFGFGYYISIMTVADALTGQQTISVITSYVGLQRINRDDRFDFLLAVAGRFSGLSWALSLFSSLGRTARLPRTTPSMLTG